MLSDGTTYDGSWFEDKKEGDAVVSKPDGSSLRAKYSGGEIQTVHSFTDPDGTVFTGTFQNGRLHGKGEAKLPNGDSYKGEFRSGKRSGYGTMTYNHLSTIILATATDSSTEQPPDSGTYEGYWKANRRQGQGTMKWSDGSRFEGEWFADKRVRGKMFMLDGLVYEGTWLDGELFHGKGRITYPDGLIFEAKFDKGIAPDIGRLILPDIGVFTGELDDLR